MQTISYPLLNCEHTTLIRWWASYARDTSGDTLDHWVTARTVRIIADPFANVEMQPLWTAHFTSTTSFAHIVTATIAVGQKHWLLWIACRTCGICFTVQWTGVAAIVQRLGIDCRWNRFGLLLSHCCTHHNRDEKDDLFHRYCFCCCYVVCQQSFTY
uniref:Uncharacterized protein n=1 Tax=Anopheles funestus TaxID=62324 RepID=A0A4Y0BL04_ANOFN